MKFANRVMNLKPSATMALDAQAKAMIAKGEDVINLTAGEPDFDPPDAVLLATIEAAIKGKTKYTPAKGTAGLLEKVAEQFGVQLGCKPDVAQAMITPGGKIACFWPLFATVDPGDEVIIMSPYWTSYPAMVELCGGVPKIFDYRDLTKFSGGSYLLEKYITEKTVAIILNSPNNPAGYVFTQEELKILAQVCSHLDNFLIISDEIYSPLVYGGHQHISIASINQSLAEKTTVINGASKPFAMTGFRIGFLWGPQELIKKMAEIQSQVLGCPCSISQAAAEVALLKCHEDVFHMRNAYEGRLDIIIRQAISDLNLQCFEPQGAFYLFFQIPDTWGQDCVGFCQELLKQQKLALVPGEAFGYPGWVRLSFAAEERKLMQGIKRLKDFIYIA